VNQRSPISPRPLVEDASAYMAAEAHSAEAYRAETDGIETAPLLNAAIVGLEADAVKAALVSPTASPDRTAVLKVFFSTFLTIFLAELGDKTQVTTLLMAAESHAPWTVFAGAGTALVATSLLGVWLGSWLSKQVSPRTLEVAAGILLLLVSAQLFWEIAQL
jgi:putative Ca2+/H+ antiporter (TMEM165/GDT1 family)